LFYFAICLVGPLGHLSSLSQPTTAPLNMI
jgi:hypothetical protein